MREGGEGVWGRGGSLGRGRRVWGEGGGVGRVEGAEEMTKDGLKDSLWSLQSQ